MNIGFDLDGIFIDAPPFVPKKFIEFLYRGNKSGKLVYRIPSEGEQLVRLITHHPLLRPPIVSNITYLRKLAVSRKRNRFLISSRFGFLKNKTEELVRKHQLDILFDSLHFNYNNKQPHLFKNEIMKKLKIEKYVDDDLALLRFLSPRHPRTIFFWLNKKSQVKIAKNLYGVTDLSQMRL